MEGKVIQFSGRNLTNVPNVTKLKDFALQSTKNGSTSLNWMI